MNQKNRLGANYLGDGRCRFTVWAPFVPAVAVHIVSPEERLVPLTKDKHGYHRAVVDGVEPGTRYYYRLDADKERPDPASRYQPQGVHGPSQVVEPSFPWQDTDWQGLPLEEYIIYELHIGTFTGEGTFEAIIPHLDYLKELGVTAVELMPVAQFPGSRNWGYDGVYPFAAQDSYGGLEALKRLVNACHRQGLAVVLDVVYNHFGPEGNYFADFAPYFTDRYHTPWGAALNFDGADSDPVRHFFIENAIYWLTEFHIDALRLDALHAILDTSPCTFLEELATAFHQEARRLKRRAYLIAESSANDARLIKSPETGGYGLDAQWNDDFHHALHTLLTAERTGYYRDYGRIQHLAKAFREGFAYSGEYSLYRRRRHGVSSRDIPAHRFSVFAQNHDQVGNRAGSERLSRLVSFESLKLAAGLVLLSPFIPLLFMGEEYGETAPFPYFISHSEPDLIEAVRRGRKAEFAAFRWRGEPPDPQAEATFVRARLNHDLRREGQHQTLFQFYRKLIELRKETPSLSHLSKETQEVKILADNRLLYLRRCYGDSQAALVYNTSNDRVSAGILLPSGEWQKRLDSAEEAWGGGGNAVPRQVSSEREVNFALSPRSFILLVKEK